MVFVVVFKVPVPFARLSKMVKKERCTVKSNILQFCSRLWVSAKSKILQEKDSHHFIKRRSSAYLLTTTVTSSSPFFA